MFNENNMKKVYKSDIRTYNTCAEATDELIEKCFNGKDSLTYKEVLDIPFFKNEHKLWLFLRPELLEQEKLDSIKIKFISLVDKSNKFYFLLENSDVQRLIGILIRCFKPQSDEDTCSILMDIVKEYID